MAGSLTLDSFSRSQQRVSTDPLLLSAIERLSSTDRPQPLLESSCRVRDRRLSLSAAPVFACRRTIRRLWPSYGRAKFSGSELRFPIDGSLAGWILRGGKTYLSDDVQAIPPFIRRNPVPELEAGSLHVLGIPLVLDSQQILGALLLFDRTDGLQFNESDQRLLERLAQCAAFGLHRAQLIENLSNGHARLHEILQNTPEIVSILDGKGTIQYESPSIERLTGIPAADLVGRAATEVVHPEDAGRLRHYFASLINNEQVEPQIEYRVQYRDGSWHHLEALVTNLLDVPAVSGVVVTSRDVTERKHFEEELINHTFSDPLTRLPNRTLFLDRLSHALASAGRRNGTVAMMLVEFERTRTVVDAIASGSGEALLAAMADRICDTLRLGDTVSRFANDQFALLFEEVPTSTKPSG